MIAVQAEGCQPVVRAFERERSSAAAFWENAHTVAAGLRVPKPLGDFLMLEARARERRHGHRRERRRDARCRRPAGRRRRHLRRARRRGLRGGAAQKLLASGFLKPDATASCIYNTGSGLKYLEAYSTRFPRTAAGEQDKLGGLITPR